MVISTVLYVRLHTLQSTRRVLFQLISRLQPNPSTLAHQLDLWASLVLSWARTERVWEVNCDATDGGGEVFWNRSISRTFPAIEHLCMTFKLNPRETSTAREATTDGTYGSSR